jgi:hypothetical protein
MDHFATLAATNEIIAQKIIQDIEFVDRQALHNTEQSLAGLYNGNPQRATTRPSTEQLHQAFCHLTLYLLPNATFFISPLDDLQRQILRLMKMPDSLYQLHLTGRKA